MTPPPPVADLTHVVSYDKALGELNSVLDQIDGTTRSSSSRRKVANHYKTGDFGVTRTDGTTTPSLHVFNFENNEGFAILSGDDRTVPVFAVTESGSLEPGQVIDNPGFGLFMIGLDMYYKETIAGVSIGGGGGGGDPWVPFIPIDIIPNPVTTVVHEKPVLIATYGSIIPTLWHQRKPFNNYCPEMTLPSMFGNKDNKAGCVAIAIAQVMAYHQYPKSTTGLRALSLNWPEMNKVNMAGDSTKSVIGTEHIGKLIGKIGSLVDMEYGVSKSTANFDDAKHPFSSFRYGSAGNLIGYNLEILLGSLNNKRPVLVNGFSSEYWIDIWVANWPVREGGHTWVIDQALGFKQDTKWYIDYVYSHTNTSYYQLLHCNWGWGSGYNGYYNNKCFDIKGRRVDITTRSDKENYYQYHLEMISNIYP